MKDNQEKELFNILKTLVTEVKDIRKTQDEHTKILNRLDAKTDTIAEKAVDPGRRLTSVEKDVVDLRGGVY